MQRALTLVILLLAGLLAQPASAACPGTAGCVVNKGCPKGAKVVNPGGSIQAAINSASSGGKICVRPGTYTGKIDFKGKNITLVSSGGPNVTILDGGGTGPVVTFKTFEGADSILNGFLVRNGVAANGGGILIQNASPTIRNCILRGNTATGDSFSRGGGLWAGGPSAKPVITCTRFLNNRADYGGGGLATTGFADPYLRSNHFEGNTASWGGGIAAHHNGRLDVAKTSFFANQATGDGGGIHAGTAYGNVLVRQSWFKGNKADGNGGGMWVPAGLAEVVNNTFDSNEAAVGGGIAAGFGSMVSVAGTIFVNNKSIAGSAALVNTDTSGNTSVVNHYNGFFGNTGGDFLDTYGDLGLLLANPQLNACCPGTGSPAIDAGIPNYHFDDANATRNDMGACGGPAI